MWDALRLDVRHSFRSLRRAPTFSSVVIVTLALAVGATAAVGSLLNALVRFSPKRPADMPASVPFVNDLASTQEQRDLLDVLNFPSSQCAATNAHWIKVYPPNQFSATYVPWTAMVCSKPKPVYLSVAPVRHGA